MTYNHPIYNTRGPECPHCGNVQTPDEAYYYDQSGYEMECGECEKPFLVEAQSDTIWLSRPKETAT